MSAKTEQSGRVDSRFDAWHDAKWPGPKDSDPYPWKVEWRSDKDARREVWEAALAQNAQGEADCWRVIIDGEYQLFDTRDEACKARAKYEGNRKDCIHYEPEPPYTHAERARVQDGWVLVPREPTEVMRDAGMDAHFHAEKRASGEANLGHKGMFSRKNRAAHVYAAMLDAAPSHPDTTGATP